MSNGRKTPDVVPRAAARFRDLGPPKSLDQILDNKVSLAADPLSVPSPSARGTSPVSREAISKRVNVSPTSLAANGIFLPSAGTVRTVEEFRVIKRHVLANVEAMSTGSQPSRVVMITSARPGEGKTYTAINLALSIAAERDFKVLLVDADVYRQCILSYLGIEAEQGWVDYLSDVQIPFSDILLHTNVPNLSVLPAGKAHAGVPELMSSQTMSQFVIELAQRYADRFIIFDSLPCLVSSEPAILARVVGQAVFVVAAHETSRDQIESSLRMISACPSVSLVLNKAEQASTERYGSYGYAYKYNK